MISMMHLMLIGLTASSGNKTHKHDDMCGMAIYKCPTMMMILSPEVILISDLEDCEPTVD